MERIMTAPVMIPNTPDCTFLMGEPVLSKEQIVKFKEDFDKYGIIDLEHDFRETHKTRGEPIHSWILPEDQQFTLLNGSPVVYPEGTWMLTSKITDPTGISLLDSGQIKGYSSSTVEKEVAEERYRMLKGKEANKSKTLIKDLDQPTTYAVTLTSSPCVFQSKFCKTKENEANKNNKNGDKMDDATLLKKVKEFLKGLGANTEEEEEPVEEEEATKCGGNCKGKKEANKTAVGSTTDETEQINEPPKKNPEQSVVFLNKLEEIRKQIAELQEANKATNERVDEIAKTVEEAEKSKKEIEEPQKESNKSEEEEVESNKTTEGVEANKSKQFDSEDGFDSTEPTYVSDTQLVYEAMGRSITGTKLYE